MSGSTLDGGLPLCTCFRALTTISRHGARAFFSPPAHGHGVRRAGESELPPPRATEGEVIGSCTTAIERAVRRDSNAAPCDTGNEMQMVDRDALLGAIHRPPDGRGVRRRLVAAKIIEGSLRAGGRRGPSRAGMCTRFVPGRWRPPRVGDHVGASATEISRPRSATRRGNTLSASAVNDGPGRPGGRRAPLRDADARRVDVAPARARPVRPALDILPGRSRQRGARAPRGPRCPP